MKHLVVIFLLLLGIASVCNAQVLMTETFNYSNDGGLADLTWLSNTSPYYPQPNANVSSGLWASTTTSAFIAPLIVETGALEYPGYGLSGLGKKVYLPTATSGQARQSARISYTGASKVYYSMMVQIKEAYQLGDMTSDLNGTAIASLNTSTSSSGIRGVLVYNRSLTPGKVRVGVSYTRDDVGTAFAATDLDTLSTHLVVISVDTLTNTASLWLNPSMTGSEPIPDAVNTNISVTDANTLKYLTLYQRDNKPSGWVGGIHVATSWAGLFSPLFSVDAPSFDMDSIFVGAWKKQTIVVTNTGIQNLVIDSVRTSNAIFSVTPATATVLPGAQQSFVVLAKLNVQTDVTGNVLFYHNGATVIDSVGVTIHPLVPELFIETFNYASGGLTNGSQTTSVSNVSDGRWFNSSSSALTDSILVQEPALSYPGYELSGLGKSVFIPNVAGNPDKAIRTFSTTAGQYTGQIYYSYMMKMASMSGLSSAGSSYGELITGVGPVSIVAGTTDRYTKTSHRGMLRVRAGWSPNTWQLGVGTSSVKTGPMGWLSQRDISIDSTVLVVVRYRIGDSVAIWLNPNLSGPETSPDTIVARDPAVTEISDFGHFSIYSQGGKPICNFGGIRVSPTWPSPVFTVTPTIVLFDTMRVNTTMRDTVLVTNGGSQTLEVSPIVSTHAMFTVSPTSASISVGGTQEFEIAYTPTATGTHAGEIQFSYNSPGPLGKVTVSGVSIQPEFLIDTSSVNFGTVIVNQSGNGSVTVSNPGSASLSVTTELLTLVGVLVNPTSVVIPAGGQQEFDLTWTPTDASTLNGTLRLNHDAISSPFDVSVSGVSIIAPSFVATPSQLNIGGIVVGSTTTQTIKVSNSGSAILDISGVVSTNSAFVISPSSASIAIGGNQIFTVTFAPLTQEDQTGALEFTHNASGSPTLVNVQAKGVPEFTFMRESFDYPVGGLTNKSSNVSGGVWINPSTNPANDSIIVENGSLEYSGFSLSGLGKKIKVTNLTGTNDPDKGYRTFSNTSGEYAGQIYYAMMLKLTDLGGLSSSTSSYGELLTGVGPVTPVSPSTDRFTKTALRGMLRFRLGTVANTFALGVNTSSVKTGPMGWVAKDLSLDSTVLVVVRYRTNDSVSVWINPDLSGGEPTPDTTVAKDPAITEVSDYGHFYIMTQGGKPHCWIDGIRLGNTWNAVAMQDSFSINAQGTSGGTITPNGVIRVPAHGNQSLTIVPDTCYQIDSVLINGVNVGQPTEWIFNDVMATYNVMAHFSNIQYTLTSAADHGSIVKSPDKEKYDCSEVIELTATPHHGWVFTGWSGDASGTTNPLTINMTSNKIIFASFVQDTAYFAGYRTLHPDSIALAKDNFKKVGKSVKNKATGVDFVFFVVAPSTGLNGVHVEFGTAIDTTYDFYTSPTSTKVEVAKSKKAKWNLTFAPDLSAGDTIWFYGHGIKANLQKVGSYWWTTNGTIVGAKLKNPTFTKNVKTNPMPNHINILEATYPSGFPTGMVVGVVATNKDSIKKYGWVYLKKSADVLKSLSVTTKGVVNVHDGAATGFDSIVAGKTKKSLLGKQTSLPPTKQDNILFANLVALKMSIAASALNVTPVGLGDLILNDTASNPWNGLTLLQLSQKADTMMTGYADRTFESGSTYAQLSTTIRNILTAFEGPIDTISFGSGLVTTGAQQLVDCQILKPNTSAVPYRITPNEVNAEIPDAFTLYQNYPNPFNPTTTIHFDLPVSSVVTLKIFNLLGQEVATILDQQQLEDGQQMVEFDASRLSSGVYFYQLTANSVNEDGVNANYTSMKKMVLMK